MPSEGGRNMVINSIMFRTASSQFSYINHMIDLDIKQDEKMRCKACVSPCMYSHFDVIFKLYHYKADRSGHFKSLYGDSVIVSDEKIEAHVAEINKLKHQVMTTAATRHIGIDYKVKTELPYNPPEAMLLHVGRGQVVRFPVDISRFPFSLLITCFTHTHFPTCRSIASDDSSQAYGADRRLYFVVYDSL
ncbi:hypothetical protein OUZ56_017589 [Daphnia magna]|uniref:Uncharacterized protein n=1 Tax=Daphnia magna TaxID=35525 RepID=A0ABR0AT71_9CRUS|nr:hypothetical protein OUZ56_017589 [Daphnia magna]